MRLSKLHINGFKSFPDRAELGFDQGVTAIVGPNGCGKSNVVDAITWVLGEQSAKSLRGERMEDVIFNGSDARKPTATAEVRLKLADVAQAGMPAITETDGVLDEGPLLVRDVEIGRRLYRSGESEYLIDGEVCRLRDIHDLLMDSGLGVKAYAVIEQGKIGQILSSRPAERRSLIEEAAGVTKYKSRRRSAELKLEAAQQNLTRIDDIIFEVEKQRNALKRQAARARRYKRLREELRRWEQVQFARKHDTLSAQIESAEARLAEARAREAAAAARVAELETGLETLRLELTEAESSASTTREASHARELQIGRRQQQIQFETQQVSDLTVRAGELGVEARELEGRREPARAAIDARKETVARARQSLADAAARVDACQLEYSRALAAVQRIEQDADETRAAVMASTTTLSALRQARDNATAVRDRVAAERSRLEIESHDLEIEAARARHERDQAGEALGGARAARDSSIQQRADVETALASARSQHDDLSDVLALSQRAMAGHEARLRSLQEMEARRATFGEAARFLLAEGASGIQQHGAVADHLDVERSYERAVDALLGGILQHVIVDSAAQVHEAGLRLTDVSAGRCGFVVLDGADQGSSARPPAVVPAGARLLSDVVRVNGPHAGVIATLLGNALIAESFEAARSIARNVSVPVATMRGEVFHGAHLVEIGSRPDVHGILETRGDIDRLRDEVRTVEAEVHQSSNAVFTLDLTIGAAELELADHVSAQHSQEKAIVGFESQVARGEEELARVTRRLDLVATERRRAEEEERTADTRREEATAAITEYETQQEGAEERLNDVMARLRAARDEAESRLRLVSDSRAEQAALSERASALDVDVLRLEEASRDLHARLAQRQAEIARTETRTAELRQSIQDTGKLLDEDIRVIEAMKHDLRTVDDRVADLRSQFGSREHEIRAARHAHENVRSQVTQSEVARATAASDLSHLAAACLEAINLSLEDVLAAVSQMEQEGELVAPGKRLAALAATDDDELGGEGEPGALAAAEGAAPQTESGTLEPGTLEPFSVEEVVAELRRKIEKLGPVNMMAIEQFDELETRHLFLTTQRKDLLDSIAQTGEAIRKIDKTTRERFAEAFASINTNFEATFTTLFGGGRAGLILIDQEHDAESGIDIIAQPPGKRLQNVQLLSGGEKALTAMALMFAIFKYRPSPFCLLDEIDAPLDDANIGRFVEMLQSMQSHTQFILITHNRKTMEIANRLYGVTMEEPGVSKLISLQF